LPRSRSPPNPNTTHTCPHELAHGREHVRERVVAVGVVHEHEPSRRDREPARGGPGRRSRLRRRGPRPTAARERTATPRRRPRGSPRCGDRQSGLSIRNLAVRPARVTRVPRRRGARPSGCADRQCRRTPRRAGTERPDAGFVGVEDRLSPGLQELREQPRLRPQVGVHGSVKVEVVARQVREHRRGDGIPSDPVLREPDARDLHHDLRPRLASDHRREHLQQRPAPSGVVNAAPSPVSQRDPGVPAPRRCAGGADAADGQAEDARGPAPRRVVHGRSCRSCAREPRRPAAIAPG
jgi:hypothetical protein